MTQLFQTLLVLHIAGGSLGLMAGTIAASVRKGKKWHLLAGKLFFYGIFVASVSSLVITNLRGHENIFLFALSGFALYLVSSGYRMILLNRHFKNGDSSFTWLDYTILIFGLTFGLFLCLLSIKGVIKGNMLAVMPGVFGLLCVWFSAADLAMVSGKKSISKSWLHNHIIRMMAALIASYTAFLVVNVPARQSWILWLAPTVIGTILIIGFIRKFVSPKTGNEAKM